MSTGALDTECHLPKKKKKTLLAYCLSFLLGKTTSILSLRKIFHLSLQVLACFVTLWCWPNIDYSCESVSFYWLSSDSNPSQVILSFKEKHHKMKSCRSLLFSPNTINLHLVFWLLDVLQDITWCFHLSKFQLDTILCWDSVSFTITTPSCIL